MRFRKGTKQFWEVVYRICHGKGLRLFSGSKDQGCLQSGGQRGTYDPDKSNHNFTVPDKKSLRKSTDNLPNVILCGIIEEFFKLLDKNKQYVISIDGKKIATGLLKDDIGDINLWGFKESSIESHKACKELDMAILEEFKDMIDNGTPEEKMAKLPDILSMMTSHLGDIRQTELGNKKLLMRLFKLSLNNPDNKTNYTFGMNTVKAYMYTTSEWMERAPQNNKDICCTMADIRQTSTNDIMSDIVSLKDMSNVRFLLHPDDMPKNIDLDENPVFIKQRTDKWFGVGSLYKIYI